MRPPSGLSGVLPVRADHQTQVDDLSPNQWIYHHPAAMCE